MAIALSGTPVSSTSGGSVTTTITVALASTTVGDYNVIGLSANTSGTGVDPAPTTPAGWTLLGTSGKTGTPYHRLSVYGRFYQAGDGTSVVVTIAASGNMSAGASAYSGVDSTTPLVGGESLFAAQGASSTSWATGAITTAAARWVLSFFANRTNGTWSALTDTQRYTQITASSANIAMEDSNGTVASGTVASRTATYSAATSVGNTGILALNPAAGGATPAAGTAALSLTATTDTAAAATAGAAVTLTGTMQPPGVNAAATLSLTASATPTPSAIGGTAALTLTATGAAGTPAQQWVRTQAPMWIAHRGGYSSTLGEETLEAYTASAGQLSTAALEISVYDTSDGVYVCSHDSTTGRVFSGTNYTINSTTWATLSPNGSSTVGRPTTLVGGNPMRRLEEILDAFPGRIFVIENKHGTNQSGLSTLLDAHALGRWIFKGPYNDTSNANTAATHGAPMWLYFYNTQLGSLSTTLTAVSGSGVPVIYGLGDFSAAPIPVQSDSNTFFAFTTSNGLKTWAHILQTSAQKTNADGQATTASSAYSGYMVSGFSTLAPTDATAAAGTAALTLTASGTGRAAGGGAASLSLTGSAAATTAAAATAAVSLTGSGSTSVAGTGTVTLTATGATRAPVAGAATVTLTGTASPSPSAVAGTASLTFTATGSTGAFTPASGTAAVTLTGSSTATGAGTGSGVVTLTATGTASVTSSGTAVVTLTGAASPLAASGGTFTVTLAATGVAAQPPSAASGTASVTLTGLWSTVLVVPPIAATGTASPAVTAASSSGTTQRVTATGTTGSLVTAR